MAEPCKTCGTCPTCGNRPPYVVQPYVVPQPIIWPSVPTVPTVPAPWQTPIISVMGSGSIDCKPDPTMRVMS